MERISIFNYEAFYLDYLEGNLNETDTALLLAFLEKHPELDLGDEALPELTISQSTLTQDDKESLKQYDENDAIVMNNAEYFMIAESEGLLSEEKRAELGAFVSGNPALERTHGMYKHLKLEADKAVVFADKGSLKRSRKIVFWPYIAGAAAAGVIAFLMLYNGQRVEEEPSNLADKESIEQENIESPEIDESPAVYQASDEAPVEAPSYESSNKKTPVQTPRKPKQINKFNDRNGVVAVERLDYRPSKPLIGALDQDIQPISADIQEEIIETQDYALTGFDHFKDPIKVVTSRLNKNLKNPVDFRTAKATKKQSGGFYLKVGKLEIARKKRWKQKN